MLSDANRRWAFLLLALWTGCSFASPHPYSIAKGHEGAPTARTMLVVPLNLVEALPPELRKASGDVANAIDAHLQAAGKTPSALGASESRSRWEAAKRALQRSEEGEPGTGSVAREFVRRLAEVREFDVVVFPSLVYRRARLFEGSRTVAWDGAERDYEIVNAPTMHGSIYLMTSPSGNMDGVSLHVYVFDRIGAKVFESFGGIDLVHVMDLGVPNTPGANPMKLKRRRLGDADAVRDGIARAFDPYITRPEVSVTNSG